jgi:hypothetical protein
VGFISPDLPANGAVKSGYIVNLSSDNGAADVLPPGGACNGNTAATVSIYFAEAHPERVGDTGQRSFAISSLGSIHFLETGQVIEPGMAGAAVWQSTPGDSGAGAGGGSAAGQ